MDNKLKNRLAEDQILIKINTLMISYEAKIESLEKPIVSLDKATIKIFYLIKDVVYNYYNT